MSFEDDDLETAAADGANDVADASGASEALGAASTAAQTASSAANLAQAAASGDPSAIAQSAMTDGVSSANQLASSLGAPEVPDVPEIPDIPSAPEIPSAPDVPEVPDVPSAPDLPSAPSVPSAATPPSTPSAPSAPSAPPGAPAGAPAPAAAPAAAPAPAPAPASPSAGPSIEDFSSIGGAARAVQEAIAGEELHQVYARFEARTDPAHEWQVSAFTVTERLGAPYVANLTIATDEDAVDPMALLGTSCAITVTRGDSERRLCGLVRSVSSSADEGVARVEVVPALSFGGLRKNTRIFQNKKVPQILEQLLNELLAPYERTANLEGLQETYPICEYRTQYEETDFDFLLRLMEEEGIFYWFDHTGEVEELLLCDGADGHPDVEGANGPQIEFVQYGSTGMTADEVVNDFTGHAVMRPTTLRTRHYDWTKPGSRFEAEPGSRIVGEFVPEEPPEDEPPRGAASGPEREVYEHDDGPLTLAEYDDGQHAYQSSDVERQVTIRSQALARDARTAAGSSSVLGFTAGAVFELVGHPQGSFDGRWLLTSVTHSFSSGGGSAYTNGFTCQPADVAFRLARARRKPRIPGVQTGIVVGPSGAEIDTDFHGRVRVQFHWDREGANDEHSSCYLRVMQPWAGQGWGFLFLPRIGMEVVVSFIGGDPDRPLVTGTVYNGENTITAKAEEQISPVDDPAVSLIRTRSTPGSEGFNELRFDDNAGAEQIYVHAQRDYVEEVLNDHNTTVTKNQSNSVGGDHSESVTGKQTLSVTKTREVTVTEDETRTIQGTETVNVTGLVTETFDGGRTTTIKGDDALTVNEGKKDDTIHGEYNILADTHVALMQKTDATLKVHKDSSWNANNQIVLQVGSNSVAIDKSGKIVLNAASEMTLVCGSAGITLKSDGTITISGSTKTEIGGGAGSVILDSAGAQMGGPQATVSAQANLSVSGAMVDIAGQSTTTITGAIVKIN